MLQYNKFTRKSGALYGIKGDSFDTAAPGLIVPFKEGVNVLVGENDSGKTTIIDAIRYALRTQSGEFIRFDEKDFHQNINGKRASEFKIECLFDGLSPQDCGLFWEWIELSETTPKRYVLRTRLYVKYQDNMDYTGNSILDFDKIVDKIENTDIKNISKIMEQFLPKITKKLTTDGKDHVVS